MAEPTATPVLPPDAAARLAEFARACKAAARAVSLYPARTRRSPPRSDGWRRSRRRSPRADRTGFRSWPTSCSSAAPCPAKPDPAIVELAELLHRQLIGGLTLNPGADTESWRTLLLLLARAPEEVRADGGIKHLWATAGGPSIEIEEIDYAEVLREKQGVAASGRADHRRGARRRPLDLDDSGMRLLLDIVQDPARLQD